ncbi:hypothetical protein [Kitasatospora sp. NPDC089509]|uniref:hypothetical protein n=1 Tax=Kitasatospora sp. NPDC089509 TaxID=3364079 RepID=UPI0037F26658
METILSKFQRTTGSRTDDKASSGLRSRVSQRSLAGDPFPLLHGLALTTLRVCLGLVYVWFGALKAAGVSPAAALVVGTAPFPTPDWFVGALGWFEVALGLWIVLGRILKKVLPFLVAHMTGTFGVLVFMPWSAFQHGNPLVLSMTGEFVVKNLVLLAAGIVVTTRSDAPRRRAS